MSSLLQAGDDEKLVKEPISHISCLKPPDLLNICTSAVNLDDDIMHAECINREKVCVCAREHVAAGMRQKYAIMRHSEREIEGWRREK